MQSDNPKLINEMDINDYLSKIRQDIDRQVNEIRSQTDSVLKDIAGQVPGYIPTRDMQEKRLLRLVTEDRLEETSKAKIGTFEKLYSDIYRSETGRPLSYGYEDLDYSSLIGLLVSVLEIEINLSVYQELRRLFGVRMPDFANRAAESRIVLLGGNYSVDVGKKEQTLGPIRALAEFKQSDLGHIIPEFGEFVRFLGSFIGIRNSTRMISAATPAGESVPAGDPRSTMKARQPPFSPIWNIRPFSR